jgi:hypothetical protein
MQVQTETQLTPLPAKPSCIPFYNGSRCDIAIKNYNQAVQQRNRERLQQDRIQNLRQQLQAQNTAAPIAEVKAQAAGVQQGAMLGFGAALVLFAIFFGVKKLFKSFGITKKLQARAASA